MSASSEWRQVERQLADLDLDVSDVLEPKELQRLFLEVRGELAAEQVCHRPSRDYPGCLLGICKIAKKIAPGSPFCGLQDLLESWGLPNNLHACLHPHTGRTTGDSLELALCCRALRHCWSQRRTSLHEPAGHLPSARCASIFTGAVQGSPGRP